MNKSYVEDIWLSKILGKKAYNLSLFGEVFSEPACLQEKNIFCYTKIQTTEIEKAKILSRFGFYLVDTNVQLKLEPQNYKHNIKPEVCFYAGPEHQDGVLQVASDSFLYSRFHLDPMFKKEMANKIKLEWCRSFFSGTRGQKMVVVQVEGKILGFLLLIDKGQGHWIIDLIAVSTAAQKLKLGSQMISYALQDNNIKLMSVGTQIANIPSLNFYEKNGFTFESAKYVYHYHGE